MAEQSIVSLSCWAECPTDLLINIVERLFFRDRHVFNSVCKSWNSVQLPFPPLVHSPNFDSPCLMFLHEHKETWKLFHSSYNDPYYLTFPELFGAQIRYSKYGWLLMYQGEDTYFFFNPSTKVKIKLPSTHHVSFVQMCFTSPPTSANNCIVFGIFSSSVLSDWELGYIKLGEHKWTMYEGSSRYLSCPTNCSPIFCNGLFYCLSQSGNLGVFNPNDKGRPWVQYKCLKTNLTQGTFRQNYMAETDGEIWSIFATHEDVSVFKLNSKTFVWDPLESLGNKCFYASARVSFVETSVDESLANKIYFNHFHDDNGVVYCLASKMYYSVVGGGFASKEDYGLTKRRDAIWFKPTRNKLEN